MKTFRIIMITVFALTLILSACSPPGTAVPTEEAAAPTEEVAEPTDAPEPTDVPEPTGLVCAEPIKVGLITDGTGALAIYGAHIIRSFMLGMEYATGAPGSAGDTFTLDMGTNTFKIDDCEITVIVKDDQSTPDTTATLARELIEVEGVSVLVGTVSSGATATLQGIAAENQIPLIVAPAAANDITGVNFNEYTFRTSRNNYQDAINLCEYLPTVYETFVQIAPDYSFGWGGAAAFRDACSVAGGEFVADDIFAPADTTEFTPYMEQILASGAEAYLVTWAGGGFVPMMQAATDLGVSEQMALGASFVDNVVLPAFFSNAVGSTSGILYHYTAPSNPVNDWLVENTKARYGVPPDLFDADGMNAAILLVEALKATNGDASAEAMIGAMEGMEFEGPKGTIHIRAEDHVAIQDMYIVKLLNVDDPEFKYFELVSTTRPEPPCLLPENLKDRCGSLAYGSLTGEPVVAGPQPLTCEEPIKVGLITDGTGALAIYGAHIMRSFMLGMEYATGAPGSAGDTFTLDMGTNTFKLDECEITVIVKDDQSTPDTTATVARELIEVEGVDVLVGTVSSGATATLQGIAAENQIPLIVAPAAANDITGVNFNEYTFRTSRNNYQDAMNLCEYLPTIYSTFVQIAPDYSFGWGGAAAFRDACTVNGGTFVTDDIFAPADTTEFTPYMEQILDSGADAWIVTWAGGGFVPMFQAAVDLGVMDQMGLGASVADNLTVPVFYSSIVGQNSGILYHYTLPTNEINDWLVEQDKARYGTPPDLFDADGMNAALLLINTLKLTRGNTDAEAMILAMEGMTFEGPKGTIYIRPEDHVAIQDMYIVKLLNVDDPEFKYFELVSTTRPEPPCLLPEGLTDRCAALPVGSLGGQ
ncbi:MAG: substrate-binding domain-containing protein [Anaerolineales bacterium]|nr:substrate-binding domain-containing protein [Anaerolineales bacterium]